uniref:Genome polyprotein n=1 Tax=Pink-eared duck picornavirus TaxID=2592518 RepID=A0A5B8KHY6_9PICO|nr:polyprotein [Pink-eared duck picornavirus]
MKFMMNSCNNHFAFVGPRPKCYSGFGTHSVCHRHKDLDRNRCCACASGGRQELNIWLKYHSLFVKKGCGPVIWRQIYSGEYHYSCMYHRSGCCLHDDCHLPPKIRRLDPQGQGISTATGNTNVVAEAGAHIVYNFYGTSYTDNWSSSQASMDPSKVMEQPSKLLSNFAKFKPIIKDPNIEEDGYSDRLIQVIASNTGVTSQDAAAGIVVGYGVMPKYRDLSQSHDKPSRPGPACDRFFNVGDLEWTADKMTGEVLLVVELPKDLIKLGVVGQNLTYHALCRMGFAVHLQCNATRFHSGALGLFLIPEYIPNGLNLPSGWNYHQLTLFPHQLLNLRLNNSATVVVPYTPPYVASYSKAHNWVSVVVVCLAPLQYAAGATTSLPVVLSISPLKSEFMGLRNSLYPEGFPVYKVPGSGEFSTTLALGGLPAYPVHSANATWFSPGKVDDWNQVMCIPTFMTFDYTSQSYPYWTLEARYARGDAVGGIFLNPKTSQWSSTYLGRLASMYVTYSGSVTFYFTFVGPMMTTGKILLAYSPPGADAPAKLEEAMLCTTMVWDFGLQSTCEFCVPFISCTPYRFGYNDANTLGGNGTITAWMQTKLVFPPGTPNSAKILVAVGAGSDLQFRTLMDSPLLNQGLEVDVGDATALGSMEVGQAKSQTPSQCFDMTPIKTTKGLEDTSMEGFFSRYHFIEGVQFQSNFARLDIDWSVIGPNPFKTKFRMVTYLRFDADWVFIPSYSGTVSSASGLLYQIMYCPPGSDAPDSYSDNAWKNPNNPSIYFRSNQDFATIRVPFLSPANYYASVYNGTLSFDASKKGSFPGNLAGSFRVRILNADGFAGSHNLAFYMRPIHIDARVPRPIFPIPNLEPQGLVDDFIGRISYSVSREISMGLLDTATVAFSRVESIAVDWLKVVCQWVVKIAAAAIILVRTNADPLVAVSLASTIGLDILTCDPFASVKSMINQHLGLIDAQGGVMGAIKDLNAAINLGRGLEWFINALNSFVEWFKEKIAISEKKMQLAARLEHFLAQTQEWDRYEVSPHLYTTHSVRVMADWMLETKSMLNFSELSPSVASIVNKYCAKASRFSMTNRPRSCEPIGCLIHGPPGTGKSLITSLIARAITKVVGGADPYYLPPDPKYFDGYKGQTVVVMDDLCQNPNGEDCSLLCQMISTTNFHPPMAAVEEKGIRFTSDFVIASTNLSVLTPSTVTVPEALKRRFRFDYDICVMPEYQIGDGQLDTEKALKPCDHTSSILGKCVPLLCGKAVRLRGLQDRQFVTVETLIELLISEHKRKLNVANSLEVLFQQGLPRLEKAEGKTLEEIFSKCDDPQVLAWFESKGVTLSKQQRFMLALRSVSEYTSKFRQFLLAGGACVALFGLVVAMCRTATLSEQGPYENISRPRPPPRPVPKIQVQGLEPDLEMAQALVRHNLVPFSSPSGKFTAFGVYGRVFVVPIHAVNRGGPYYLEGREINIEYYAPTVNGLYTEIAVCRYTTGNEFRDVRHMLPDTRMFPVRDSLLVMNSDAYRSLIVNTGMLVEYSLAYIEDRLTTRLMQYRYPTVKGYCGGVLIHGGKIWGMHVAGDGVLGYAAQICPSYFIEVQGVIVSSAKRSKPIYTPTRSELHPSAYQLYKAPRKAPAVLSRYDKRCECDLDLAVMSKYKGDPVKALTKTMQYALSSYADQLHDALYYDGIDSPLSLQDAVFGFGNLDAMDLKTSAGYPYVLSGVRKTDLVDAQARDCSRLADALDLHGTGHPFVTFKKDELRPLDKIKLGKTRLIECSSFNDSVVLRQKIGRIMEQFVSNCGTKIGSAIGCNPDKHWTQFYDEFRGLQVYAFDYSNFDASVPGCLIRSLNLIFLKFGVDIGKELDHIALSHHIYEDMDYIIEGGMVSGSAGTSLFNTMCNNVMVRTFLLEAYDSIDLSALKVLAYGDDLIIGYPHQLDCSLLVQVAKNYGMTLTPPDKGEVFPKPGIENVTFLKRRFVPDKIYSMLIHPVYPLDEAVESLLWTRDATKTQEHVLSLCHLVWHSGKKVYEEFVKFVRAPSFGHSLKVPSYETLYGQWLYLMASEAGPGCLDEDSSDSEDEGGEIYLSD